jgi:hypothetical protein
LIVWHAPWPDGPRRAQLEDFVQSGGAVLVFASGQPDALFGEPVPAAADVPFRVTTWSAQEGLLANTSDGKQLPVSTLAVIQRQPLAGEWSVLGAFADGSTFLGRRQLGAGFLYACATSPATEWSGLGDGLVLVPMLQRALQAGGRRLGSVTTAVCGDQQFAGVATNWQRVDDGPVALYKAGVYQDGNRWIVLNRPAAEDDPETVDEAGVRELFGPVSLRFFEQPGDDSRRLQSEVWRLFLWAMLLFLTGEALLALPGKQPVTTADEFGGRASRRAAGDSGRPEARPPEPAAPAEVGTR